MPEEQPQIAPVSAVVIF